MRVRGVAGASGIRIRERASLETLLGGRWRRRPKDSGDEAVRVRAQP
ncbi:hypothetical protein J4G37_02610 [Microvirga sp. 3-52]|nr:hypothetical protein [Microvirga sp. 3-52]